MIDIFFIFVESYWSLAIGHYWILDGTIISKLLVKCSIESVIEKLIQPKQLLLNVINLAIVYFYCFGCLSVSYESRQPVTGSLIYFCEILVWALICGCLDMAPLVLN